MRPGSVKTTYGLGRTLPDALPKHACGMWLVPDRLCLHSNLFVRYTSVDWKDLPQQFASARYDLLATAATLDAGRSVRPNPPHPASRTHAARTIEQTRAVIATARVDATNGEVRSLARRRSTRASLGASQPDVVAPATPSGTSIDHFSPPQVWKAFHHRIQEFDTPFGTLGRLRTSDVDEIDGIALEKVRTRSAIGTAAHPRRTGCPGGGTGLVSPVVSVKAPMWTVTLPAGHRHTPTE